MKSEKKFKLVADIINGIFEVEDFDNAAVMSEEEFIHALTKTKALQNHTILCGEVSRKVANRLHDEFGIDFL